MAEMPGGLVYESLVRRLPPAQDDKVGRVIYMLSM